jgi:xylulokinase
MPDRVATEYLIGLDVGSTHVKAVLVAPGSGPGSGVVHVARRDTPTHAVRGGGAYHEPEELLTAAESAIAECAAVAANGAGWGAERGAAGRLPAGRVVAIGVASMAEAGVPLDSGGRPAGRIMAWFDPRPAPQAEWLERQIGAPALFARTGLRPEPKYTLPKLLWLREHEPRTMARLRSWAGVAELVANHLTGELATNASLACRTALFDVAGRQWDPELLGIVGLSPDRMPPVLPLGRAAGGLTAAAAARLGLAAGTPLAIAGHDHMAGALGAGVARPGDVLDSMGSAEVAALLTRSPMLADELRRAGFSSGCHALDGTWYVAGGLQASGALVEWFIDGFMGGAGTGGGAGTDGVGAAAGGGAAPGGRAAAGSMPDRYAAFLRLLEEAGPNPAGPVVRPYLRGRTAPHRDPATRFSVEGLTEAEGLADLAAALIDGAAFHVHWMLDELERLTATTPRRVRVIGGGARNPRWIAAKAALGPGRFEVARTDEAAALGAALVAGVAGGVYGSITEALADAAPSDPVRVPSQIRARYDVAYRERWLPAILAGLAD